MLHAVSPACLRFAMSAVSFINSSCRVQWVAGKALVDYVTTGVSVVRDVLRKEVILQLRKDAADVASDKWISIFNTDKMDSKRAMAKAGSNGDAAMGHIFTFAQEHLRLIDQKRTIVLGRGSTFLCSRTGCMEQQVHKDFPDFNMDFNHSEKPTSTIVALCDGTQLHFFVGSEKRKVIVNMNAGDIIFFAGDVLHAGAGWLGQEPNYRLFMYWPTSDIFVPWRAQNATEILGHRVSQCRVPNIRNHYDVLKLATNPHSASFSPEEYSNYLWDFVEHAFYKYDTELYLQGIGANIDGHEGKVLEVHYNTIDILQIKKTQDCQHFNAMPFICSKHLSKCRKRCFYCIRHLRQEKTEKPALKPRSQREGLPRENKIQKCVSKISQFMAKIEKQLKVISKA